MVIGLCWCSVMRSQASAAHKRLVAAVVAELCGAGHFPHMVHLRCFSVSKQSTIAQKQIAAGRLVQTNSQESDTLRVTYRKQEQPTIHPSIHPARPTPRDSSTPLPVPGNSVDRLPPRPHFTPVNLQVVRGASSAGKLHYDLPLSAPSV